jgi:threonine synthase
LTYSALTHLECSRTGDRHAADQVHNLSKAGAPLLARYDLAQVAAEVTPADIAARPPDLWRYHEVLPVRSAEHVVTLGEGCSPLLPAPRFGARIGLPHLLVKDEGQLPTGSFKARGAAVGVSRAAELGVTGVAMPTNGNAGAAWALYAARAGLDRLVVMPVDGPPVTRAECVAAGAELYLVDGYINDAGALCARAVAERPGCLEVSTLKEPYRVEGKKTMGYEIVEQLGWRVPEVILYPAGGGVGLIAIHKALGELRELGWIGPELPKLVAVQTAGCAPIVRAFEAGATETEPWADARTVAFGTTVPRPLGGPLVLAALRATGGAAIAVTDAELLAAQRELAAADGFFVCPEGAACFAAARRLREQGWLTGTEEVVVLNTGAGLKYPRVIPVDPPVLRPDGRIPPR